jgi:uncharacterized membrane protein
MATDTTISETSWLTRGSYRFLVSFPIACFSLTVLSDIAYWQTSNLLWLHFSEWLLFAGLVFGFLAALMAVANVLIWKTAPSWIATIGWVVVFLLAVLNSFIHTADGWTAVVPYGMTVSFVTVVLMLIAGWFGRKGATHV